MFNKSVKNTLLLGIAAALLNYSFAIAQPANPPSSGALTPNFTGLNVSGDAQVGGSLRTDYITTQDPTATEVIFGTDIFTEQNLTVSDDTTTTTLYTRNIRPFVNETDINVLGNLKTDSIGVNSINTVENAPLLSVLKPLEVSQLETDTIISKDDSGEPVRIDDDLTVNDRLQVNSDSFLRNTNINGTLSVNTIEARTGTLTTFPENIQVNGDLEVDGAINSAMGITSGQAAFGSLRVNNQYLTEFIGGKVYSRLSEASSASSFRQVSCFEGDTLLSCGAKSASTNTNSVRRIYRSGPISCGVKFSDSGLDQQAEATCLSYF